MAFNITEFEDIYKRCFARAMGLAVSLLYNREDARDIVQHVFVSLWESELRIDNPEAFVYRAVRNACINHIEAHCNHERIKHLYAIDIEEDDYDHDQRMAEVREAVRSLPERQQQVVDEVFTHGRSYRDAASNLNLSVSSINKHVVGALKSLRQRFR